MRQRAGCRLFCDDAFTSSIIPGLIGAVCDRHRAAGQGRIPAQATCWPSMPGRAMPMLEASASLAGAKLLLALLDQLNTTDLDLP